MAQVSIERWIKNHSELEYGTSLRRLFDEELNNWGRSGSMDSSVLKICLGWAKEKLIINLTNQSR